VKLLQVVPREAGLAGGVGQYAEVLGQALRRTGASARTLAVGPGQSPILATELGLLAQTSAERAAVLVHYSNYGFARRGCPVAMVRHLVRWRRSQPAARLVGMFHEVFATGPPWRSSFWLSPVQTWLARHLASACDETVTSLRVYGNQLGGLPGVHLRPVFSTVGEPASLPGLGSRPPRLVVLGGAGNRLHLYRTAGQALKRACRDLAISEVIDVGPDLGGSAPLLDGVAFHQRGLLGAAELSDLLLSSRAGAIWYPAPFLAKSTVFAAYCAHGMLPICLTGSPVDSPEGPQCGLHYWLATERAPTAPEVVARAASTWYAGHGLALQAADYQRWLFPAT
jgi:hypothetical protein